ncbi:efflux RND transporter periplasmic adaptor subunit [Pseudoalteromonas luteoviolacea]|uniref:Uncharacterized protein n=1 Tax=Pseudoalteromonas luteoviolacea DSM 6061 TaxID=1365250 RepID=A0A167CBH3_9GAMM|nr:efflux RND transporter periplasmic adaptor subunit [Pseudoalteromonas luteoviolacea]KZN47464.1 hypothetical protein N475_06195 [Pseudoalteromonas luteoviolacea DSM 6061]MBE0388643.1 hypothetical protein [Pseudoalteromonas luteoviolacea DSM 6061]
MHNLKQSIYTIMIIAAACQLMPTKASANNAWVKLSEVSSVQKAPKINMNARVFSKHETRITAAIDGQLTYVAEVGTRVEAGGIVAKMDTVVLDLEIREKKLQIQKAELLLDHLNSNLARLTSIEQKNVTDFEIDKAESERNIAKSDLELFNVQLEQLEDKVRRAAIRTPYDGIVTKRWHRVGEYINNSDLIINMLDTKNLEVRLDIPLKHRAYIKMGDEIIFKTLDSQFKAPVSALIPSFDSNLQTFEMRVSLPESANIHLNIGELVSAAIPVNKKQNQLTVKRDALIIRKQGSYVFKYDQSTQQVQKVPVKVGFGDSIWAVVQGDLKIGEQVVVRGGERLSNGQKVTVNML